MATGAALLDFEVTGGGIPPERPAGRVPRDRDVSFVPRIGKKRRRCLSGVNGIVLSLAAKGRTYGEICPHLAEDYGAEVSTQTASAIIDAARERLAEWLKRYPAPAGPQTPDSRVGALPARC